MSLPMAATGPLKLETNPILTVFCWARAGAVASAAIAQAANKVRFMTKNPPDETLQKRLARGGLAAQFEALNLAGRGLGQVGAKLDPARVFEGRKLGFDVVLECPRHC